MSARTIRPPMPKADTSARAVLGPQSIPRSPARTTYDTIKHLGRFLDDLERLRKMNGNRVGSFARVGRSGTVLEDVQAGLVDLEDTVRAELTAVWKQHPLAPWAESVKGLGPILIARLLAETGDPAKRPNPGKLLSYCGHGEVRKMHKGMTQAELFRCGNPRAKTRVYLIAVSMLKCGNRAAYDSRRAQTMSRDWTDGHKHADALRIVGKEFLKELWNAARAGQAIYDTQPSAACAGQS